MCAPSAVILSSNFFRYGAFICKILADNWRGYYTNKYALYPVKTFYTQCIYIFRHKNIVLISTRVNFTLNMYVRFV